MVSLKELFTGKRSKRQREDADIPNKGPAATIDDNAVSGDPVTAKVGDSDMEDVVRTVTNPERRRELFTSRRPTRQPEGVDVPDTREDVMTDEDSATVKIEDLDEDDIVIAVMGPTGSGKGTFIRVASGVDTLGVGHSLKSYTNHVSAVRFFDETSNRHVVLVDTPGFDDTYISDFEILEMISEWLNKSYKKDKCLSGILYLHRITDNRMAGTPLKSLRIFRKLCGEDALDNICLTTTMWDEVDEETGKRRLEELKQEYWKGMILQGSQTACCRSDDDSSKTIIRGIINRETTRRTPLPQEVTDQDKDLKETEAAGQERRSQLKRLVEKRKALLQRINKGRKEAMDPGLLVKLQMEYDKVRAQIDDVTLHELKVSPFKLFHFFRKRN